MHQALILIFTLKSIAYLAYERNALNSQLENQLFKKKVLSAKKGFIFEGKRSESEKKDLRRKKDFYCVKKEFYIDKKRIYFSKKSG